MTAPRPAWIVFYLGLVPLAFAVPQLSDRMSDAVVLVAALIYLPLLRVASEWMERRINRLLALRRIARKRARRPT